MKKVILVALVFIAVTALASADPWHASLTPAKADHHRVQRHHAHKAGKHHAPKRHRRSA